MSFFEETGSAAAHDRGRIPCDGPTAIPVFHSRPEVTLLLRSSSAVMYSVAPVDDGVVQVNFKALVPAIQN